MTIREVENAARRVLNARINDGRMSVKLCARLTGISTPHVSNFRNGKRRLSSRALDNILDLLCIEVFTQAKPKP
jgi:hypothetical protein